MKIFKSLLIALAVILSIALTGIYFLPNHYSVTSTIDIKQPAGVIYSQISNYENWGHWSPWKEKEPEAKYTIENTPAMPGHKMSWVGSKIGEGSALLTEANSDKLVVADLSFVKPFKAKANDRISLDEANGVTTVTWTTKGGLKFPFGRLFGLSVDKMMGAEQKHGLNNLKTLCENIQAPAEIASADTSTVVTIR